VLGFKTQPFDSQSDAMITQPQQPHLTPLHTLDLIYIEKHIEEDIFGFYVLLKKSPLMLRKIKNEEKS